MPRPPDPNPATSERTYDAEQAEWLAACARYQQQKRRKFLLATDYLAIAAELGYAKPVAGSPPAGETPAN